MNWDDPAARLALIERVGAAEYNRRLLEHQRASTIAVVNGYSIRPVGSRFGTLYHVDGTNTAFAALVEAEAFAKQQPPRTSP
jgi:hypothetical protein